MERAHPDVTCGTRFDELHDTFFHLLGGFVGERQRHNRERVDALLNHICDAVGEGTSLARAGSRDDHHRTFYRRNRLSLRLIQKL